MVLFDGGLGRGWLVVWLVMVMFEGGLGHGWLVAVWLVTMVIRLQDMSSGGVDPPRDSLTSSTSSSSSVSILVRSPDVAPIQSPPPTEARQSSCHVNARGPSLEPTPTPSPSSIDARGPSPVPTSTPVPSPPVGNMPTDEDAINLATEEPLPPPPLNDLLMVTLINGSQVEAKAATLSIRQQFGQPWPTWGAIPKDHHELFPSILRPKTIGHMKSEGVYTQEEFEARLSQARSDVALSVGESQLTPLDPDEEQRLRSRC
ncbi:hypothetical protein GmHk_09G025513 [Glycine max]|nr:hypothetical protein GmHk_09G025513 [Glycine max]